jgi:NAD(P)-dependent dehydrogenase (short-subunit alcohol dehydrogenase family)
VSLALADIDVKGLEEVADELAAETLTLEVDISDHEAVASAVETTSKELGYLDAAFANVGIVRISLPVQQYSVKEWQEVIDVNLNGVFYTVRDAAQVMDSGGSILTNASVLSTVASDDPGIAAYTASKSGVAQLTKQAIADLGNQRIRVNAVAPGWNSHLHRWRSLPEGLQSR